MKPMGHDVSKYSDASPRRISSLPTSSSFAAAAAKIESMLRNGDIYTTESPLYSLPLCKNSRSYENFSVVVPLGNPKIPQVHWSVVKVPWISRYDNGEWMKENRADSESEDACAVLSYAVIKAMYPVGCVTLSFLCMIMFSNVIVHLIHILLTTYVSIASTATTSQTLNQQILSSTSVYIRHGRGA